MARKEINVKVKAELTGVNKLRSELKDVKNELADALSMEDADPGKIEELTTRAGQLKDQLTEVNEQVDIFATGSKYEAVSKSIGSIGKSLLSLDFGKASDRADAFAAAAKKITFKDAIGSVKDLGKTFATIGKALITNPLFLLGTIIGIIVKAVYEWLDSIGFIQKALDILMMPLNLLIDGLKALGDWLGLTSFAEEEAAEKAAIAAEKRIEAHKRANREIEDNLSNQIRLMRAQGASIEEIEDAEMELTSTRLKNFIEENKMEMAKLEVFKRLGIANKEQLDQLAAYRKEFNKLQTDIEVMDADIARKREERANKEVEDDKRKNEKIRQENLKRKKETEKFIEDIRRKQELAVLNEIEDEIEKNEKIALQRLEWSKKDIDFTKMSVEAKLAYEEWYSEEVTRIQQESVDRRKAINDQEVADEKARLELLREDYNQYLYNLVDDEFEIINRAADEEIERLKKYLEDGIITREEFLEREKEVRVKAEKDIQDIIRTEDEKTANARRDSLKDFIGITQQSMSAIGNLMEAQMDREIAAAKGNEKKQEQLRKKAFEKNKKMQIAMAVMGLAQGIISGLGAPFPMNIALPIIAGITGVANIAKISATKYDSGGSSSPSLPSSGAGDSAIQRSIPSATFMGQGNNQNTVGAGGGSPQTNMTVTAVVSETEMTDVQNKNANRIKNAEL